MQAVVLWVQHAPQRAHTHAGDTQEVELIWSRYLDMSHS